MGGVPEKAFLAADKPGKALGHGVDRLAEPPELVPALGIDADVEIPLGDLLCGPRNLGKRARDIAHQRQPEEQGERQRPQPERGPRADVKKQAAAAQALGYREEDLRLGRAETPIAECKPHAHPVGYRAFRAHHELRMRPAQVCCGAVLRAVLQTPLPALAQGARLGIQQGKRELAAQSREPVADLDGKLNRRACNTGSVGPDDRKFHPFVAASQPLQHGIPAGARRFPQLVFQHAGDHLHAAGDLARQQGVEPAAELEAEETVQHRAQQEQVQKEPEQDFGVEGKAEVHSGRISR